MSGFVHDVKNILNKTLLSYTPLDCVRYGSRKRKHIAIYISKFHVIQGSVRSITRCIPAQVALEVTFVFSDTAFTSSDTATNTKMPTRFVVVVIYVILLTLPRMSSAVQINLKLLKHSTGEHQLSIPPQRCIHWPFLSIRS